MDLSFFCNTHEASDFDVVIFQKNMASAANKETIAWQVFKNPAKGTRIPFTYSLDMQISATITGQETSKQDAMYGQLWEVVSIDQNDVLMLVGDGSSELIQFQNNLSSGSVTVNIYRSGNLAAGITSLAPGQKTKFEFLPDLWMGVVPKAEQGQVLSSSMIKDLHSQISLLGVASADIVMTGGGSRPFIFEVKHVVPS